MSESEDNLSKKVEHLEKKINQLKKGRSNQHKGEETGITEDPGEMSRRNFIKKMAGGAAGIGAMGMIGSASGLDIPGMTGMSFHGGSSGGADVMTGSGCPRAYDTYIYQENDTFYIEDEKGNEINSGSDGNSLLQEAIDQTPPHGTIIVAGCYDISEQITVGDHKSVIGYEGHLRVEAESEDMGFAMKLAEGSEEEQMSVTEDIGARENHIYVDNAGAFSTEDLVVIEKDETYSAGQDDGLKYGELHRVHQVEDDYIILAEGVYFDYPSGADAIRISPDSAHLEGLKFTSPDNTGSYRAVEAVRSKDVVFHRVETKGVGRTSLSCDQCYGTHITDCKLSNSLYDTSGYGIRLRSGCSNTLISNNQIRTCRHCISHNYGNDDGIPRKTIVTGNEIHGSNRGGAIDAHEGACISLFVTGNNLSANDNSAVITGAFNTFVYNNHFHSVMDEREDEGAFVRTRGGPPKCTMSIRNNSIKHGGKFGTIFLNDENDDWKHVDISNNFFHDAHDHCFRAADTNTIEHLTISNNVFDNSEAQGSSDVCLFIEGSEVEGGKISDNTFRTYSEAIVTNSEVSNLTVMGNSVYARPWDNGSNAFQFDSLDDSVIANNIFHDPEGNLGSPIEVGSSGNVTIRHNETK